MWKKSEGEKAKSQSQDCCVTFNPPPPPKKKPHSGKKLLSGYQRESLHAPLKLTRMRVSGKPSHLPSTDFVDHNNKLWNKWW